MQWLEQCCLGLEEVGHSASLASTTGPRRCGHGAGTCAVPACRRNQLQGHYSGRSPHSKNTWALAPLCPSMQQAAPALMSLAWSPTPGNSAGLSVPVRVPLGPHEPALSHQPRSIWPAWFLFYDSTSPAHSVPGLRITDFSLLTAHPRLPACSTAF